MSISCLCCLMPELSHSQPQSLSVPTPDPSHFLYSFYLFRFLPRSFGHFVLHILRLLPFFICEVSGTSGIYHYRGPLPVTFAVHSLTILNFYSLLTSSRVSISSIHVDRFGPSIALQLRASLHFGCLYYILSSPLSLSIALHSAIRLSSSHSSSSSRHLHLSLTLRLFCPVTYSIRMYSASHMPLRRADEKQ